MRPFGMHLAYRPVRNGWQLGARHGRMYTAPRSLFTIGAAAMMSLMALCGTASAGVVAHYSFDADATTDSGGNGLDLNASGSVSLAAGQFGSAVNLDAGEYLWNASSLFNVSTSDFAISFWYNTDSNAFSPMVTKTHTNSDLGYAIGHNGTNVSGDVRDTVGGVTTAARPGDDSTSFQHLVFQRTGSALELYVNGVLADSAVAASTVDTSNAFVVGARNISSGGAPNVGGGTFYYDGLIDELWVFDNALTAIEIANLRDGNSLVADVPEPAGLALLGTGVLLLGARLRRRRAA
ncbi:MAG: PEP-CTERM sorting domain-containing protein [Alphaproteobacteria bacterium]|nr:PEP-CTERM sorting domain-containing protein [Alphaproteobacteria bacterium]MPY70382.1 PEP-CTERM sorting domain-containing protein [Alphaproteobacteria bacterium]